MGRALQREHFPYIDDTDAVMKLGALAVYRTNLKDALAHLRGEAQFYEIHGVVVEVLDERFCKVRFQVEGRPVEVIKLTTEIEVRPAKEADKVKLGKTSGRSSLRNGHPHRKRCLLL